MATDTAAESPQSTLADRLRTAGAEALDEAVGRSGRADPVLPASGGPAGNARLTAWTGLLLLVLIGAELVTLLDVRGLMSWHLVIGALLIPPALLKTGSTSWRIVRYYTGNRPYRSAGPPPMLLRILGPVVILGTVAVLATGLALVFVGAASGRQALLTMAGVSISLSQLHKAAFVGWAVATGLHALGRIVPALRHTLGRPGGTTRIPGWWWRWATLAGVLLVATLGAVLVFDAGGSWRHQPAHHRDARADGVSEIVRIS